MVLTWPSPLIIAHRGASAYAPENTLAAIELAIDMKAHMVELDTKLTADEHVVVIHDQTVDRTTDGSGKVMDLSLAELKMLNAGSQFSVDYGHANIPTLDEVFEFYGGKTLFNIELTNYTSPFDQLPEKVSQLIKRYDLQNSVLVSSFHPIPLSRFHKFSPDIPIALLARAAYLGFLSRGWLGRALIPYQALHPNNRDVTKNLIDTAHHSGHRVHPYTVNDQEEIKTLFRLGIDGIITDDPALVSHLLSNNESFVDHNNKQ